MKALLTRNRVAGLVVAALSGGVAGGLLASAPAPAVSVPPEKALSAGTGCSASQATVTVSGTATAQGAPDEVTISLGTHTSAPTAQAAMAENATKAQALVDVLAAAGVAKPDIQTSNLSVQPNYNSNGYISGYEVDNDLTVTLQGATELGRAGNVIDAAGKVAGNALRIDGISFTLSDTSALMAEARAAAVRQARSQAAAMAIGAGDALGPLCSLRDESQVSPPPTILPMALPAVRSPSTPLEGGSLQVAATVMAVFALVPAVS